jgi:hypothetical protein
MLASPFTFFRGAALIMAADLAPTPGRITVSSAATPTSRTSASSVPEELMFDINDFDETLPGPWEWDVKRLAASFEICGRHLGFDPAERRDVVMAAVRTYRKAMRRAARMRALDVWDDHIDVDAILAGLDRAVRKKRLGKTEAKEAVDDIAKASARDHLRVFSKRVGKVDGELRFVADPPLIVPVRPDASGHRPRGVRQADSLAGQHVPALACTRAPSARGVPPGRHRSEGRGRGECGNTPGSTSSSAAIEATR